MMLLWLLACHTDPAQPHAVHSDTTQADTADSSTNPTTSSVEWVVAPTFEQPRNSVRLARELIATTNVPTSAVLTIDDGETIRDIAFPGETTEHRLAVLGLLADHTHDIELRVTDAAGHTLLAELSLTVDALEMTLPDAEVLQSDVSQSQPGYTLCPVRTDATSRLIAYDAKGRVRWVQARVGTHFVFTIRPDGLRSGLAYDTVELGNMLGDPIATFGASNTDILIDELPPHHEVFWNDDGSFWTLTKDYLEVDDFPTSREDPYDFSPATIEADVAIRVLPDGTVAQRIEVASLIPTQHASMSSNQIGLSGFYDWSHANAVWPLPDENALLISLRHQDAVLKVDLRDESLIWLLAQPEGWPVEIQDKLLTAIDSPGFLFPTHSHAAMMIGDELTLFDNGNNQRANPYVVQEPAGLFSRLVTYRIDEQALTVEQIWEFREPADGPLFSKALGNADVLENGNVLGTFSYLYEEGGIENTDAGLGETSIRLIEIDPSTQDVAWDMRISSNKADQKTGWLADRCVRTPSLYAEGIETLR